MAASSQPLILGTRGSELALTQTNMVRAALAAAGIGRELETRIIATTGDKRQDLRLSAPNVDKAVFTKELEEALAAGEIDAAVHSLKDVPTLLEDAFTLIATLPRAPVEDVLVTKVPEHAANGLDSLPPGSCVATSSVRRMRQIQLLRPDLRLIEIRGNVPTRLRKVATLPEIDATILARAGLLRLGFDLSGPVLAFEEHHVGIHIIAPDVMLPAAGQGAIAIEARAGDDATAAAFASINDVPTWLRIRAERAFLHALGAGCQTPVGVHSELLDQNRRLRLKTIVFRDDSTAPCRAEAEGDALQPDRLAQELMSQVHGC